MKARVYYAPNYTTLAEWQAHLVTSQVPSSNALNEIKSDFSHSEYHWGVYDKRARRIAIVEDYFDLVESFVKTCRSGRFQIVEEIDIDKESQQRLVQESQQAITAWLQGLQCPGSLVSSTGDSLLYGRVNLAQRDKHGRVLLNNYGNWPQINQMKEAVRRAVKAPTMPFTQVVGQ